MYYSKQREEMVENQLKRRGIRDERVLKAFEEVKRELFVPENLKSMAYRDQPLPIGYSQTISQPYIVAKMTEMLEIKEDCKILEIGTGSGYQAAILSKLGSRDYTMERIGELRKKAKTNLNKHSIKNVQVVQGDGTIGLSQYEPFDRIIVTAASPAVPDILIDQLANNGIMVIPVGSITSQYLLKLVKKDGEIIQQEYDACRFVPLVGRFGFKE